MHAKSKGTLLVLISAATFGTEAIFVKLLYGLGLDTVSILFWRYLIAGAVLTALALVFARPRCHLRGHVGLVIATTMVGTITSASLVKALATIPAGVAILVFYSYPTMLTIWGRIAQGERTGMRKVMALVVSLTGLILVLKLWEFGALGIGVGWAVFAAVSQSVNLLLLERLVRVISPLWANALTSLNAVIVWGIVSVVGGTLVVPVGIGTWWVVLGAAFVATVIPYATMYAGLQWLRPSTVGILSTVEPMITASLGALILGESMIWLQWLGGVLVVLGVILIHLYEKSPEAEPPGSLSPH